MFAARPARLALAFLALNVGGSRADDGPSKKVVIPFDFESKFDNGDYGRIIGDMLWKKLHTQGGFILPETMQDVRDSCQRSGMRPNPETPLATMREFVVKDQAGDVGIWGKVERVQGYDEDVYDLWIKVVDFSAESPKVVYETKARTKTVSEIPHLYVKQALDKLYGRTEVSGVVTDPAVEERWAKAPNLVKGDFEQGQGGPAGWDPLHAGVTWISDRAGGSNAKNRIIRFTMDEEVAGTYGVLYYSAFFPVQEGATYRFQCRWKSSGCQTKVFIKCYDELGTDFNKSRAGIDPLKAEKREVYRNQENLTGPPNTWNTQTEDFTPEHTQFTPRWGRVMLYGYWPAGTVEWDDVVVKQIKPAPEGKAPKDRRPSMETKVRTKDLQEEDQPPTADKPSPPAKGTRGRRSTPN